ncbi:hypothetical protein BC829DRAFT_297936 [Chytridium lagenaria]|nr:hypothetical protein BC829DRAFT_297936 [Chytridium lagenaria]
MRQSTAIHNNSNNNSNNNNGNMNVFSDRTILSALGLGPALSLSDLDIEALLTAFPPTVPSVSSLPSWIDPMLISGGEDGSSDAPLLLDIPFQSNHQQQVFQQHQQHQFTHFSYDNSASTTTAFSSSPISQASPTLSSSAPASPTANCFDPIAFGIQPPVASVHKPSVAVDAFASFASTISASIPNLPTANPSPPPSLCSYTHSLSHALQTDDDTVSITSTSTRAPRPVRHPIGLMFTQAASIPNLPTSNPSPPPSVASYAPSVSYGFQADDDAASICSSSTSAPRPVRHPVGLMLNQAFAAPNAQFGLALRMGHGMVSPAASSVTSSSALGSMEFPFQTSEHQQSKKRQSGKDEPSLALRIDQTPKAPPSIYDPWGPFANCICRSATPILSSVHTDITISNHPSTTCCSSTPTTTCQARYIWINAG